MARYPILAQTHRSGLQKLVVDWAAANWLQLQQALRAAANVLAALVTFLTARFFEREIPFAHL